MLVKIKLYRVCQYHRVTYLSLHVQQPDLTLLELDLGFFITWGFWWTCRGSIFRLCSRHVYTIDYKYEGNAIKRYEKNKRITNGSTYYIDIIIASQLFPDLFEFPDAIRRDKIRKGWKIARAFSGMVS